MKFANPAFLYALGVLAIPILIHLFNFRRYKTLYFSSLRFLKNVEEETKSTQKLKHILVLILRCLAFICLVLAFAQPYVPIGDNQVKGKNYLQSFYIDNSFSMQAMGIQGELLSEAKESTKSIIGAAQPNTNFIILTNALSGLERRILSKQEALDKIDKINISPERKNISDVIKLHKEIINRKSKNAINQFVLLSDFQENQTEIVSAEIDSTVIYQLLQLQPQNTSNLFVDTLWFSSPLRKINKNNELNVRVRNTSNSAKKNVELTLNLGDYTRNMLVDIDANSESIKTFNYTDKELGRKNGFIEINDEQMYFDDKLYFSYTLKNSLNVLILNNQKSLKNPSWVYETDDYYNVQNLNYKQVQREQVLNADLVLLNGLNELSSGQISLYEDFINAGGSLFIIPGTELKVAGFNQLLSKYNLPSFGKRTNNSLSLNKLNTEDDFYEGIFKKAPEKLDLPNISQYYPFIKNSNFNAIDLISFQNKTPYLIKSNNQFRVYALNSALQKDFSKIIEHSMFSTVLLKIGELAQRNNAIYSTLGENSTYKLRLENQEDKAIHLKNEQLDIIPAIFRKNNYVELNLDEKQLNNELTNGIYSIEQDKDVIGNLALNYAREESSLIYTPLEQIENELKNLGATKVNGNTIVNAEEIAQLDLEKPQTYWRILLFLSLVFLIIEMLILRTRLLN